MESKSIQGFLKNILAAEKMVYPVARSNRVDGRGRGIRNGGNKSLSGTMPKYWLSYPNVKRHTQALTKKQGGMSQSQCSPIWYTMLMLLLLLNYGETAHRPYKRTLIQAEESRVIEENVTVGAPSFNVTICDLLGHLGSGEDWNFDHCKPPHKRGSAVSTYWCPSSNPGKGYCNYPNQYYCAYWGCETIATAWSIANPDKYLQINWWPRDCRQSLPSLYGSSDPGNCKTLEITVLQPQDQGWSIGKTWGVRIWETRTDRGTLIKIQKEPAPEGKSQSIGPNAIIEKIGKLEINKTSKILNITMTDSSDIDAFTQPEEVNPLWTIINASYQVINKTHPNLTAECWLCLTTKPPYFEAIGLRNMPKIANESNPGSCRWENNTQGISLQQVQGQGICIGQIPPGKRYLCINGTLKANRPGDWIIPANNSKWICSKTRLTPCVSMNYLKTMKEFCIQVVVIPKITYHPKEYEYQLETVFTHQLTKREPITALTLGMIMALSVAGVGTGIASIVNQNQEFSSLRVAVDEDLLRIEQSITALEKSVRSLSEVVLQNRRGLDLLFFKEGGLCVALKEECCVYADHTGLVRNTMNKLRENIEKQKKEYESQQSWYETWFRQSPWLTTLLSTIAGPLILLMLVLMFGPCIFNKVIAIVRSRLEAAHLLLVKAKYEQLPNQDDTELFVLRSQELQRFNEQNK